MARGVTAALILSLSLALGGCESTMLRGEKARIEPSYVFALGAHLDDVQGMLGYPGEGPRFDRLTQTTELIYGYPFPAIQAETQFPNGVTRAEMVDQITMFFNRDGVLVKMASRTDRWYPSFTDLPVQRITVLPRVVHRSGEITAPRPAAP